MIDKMMDTGPLGGKPDAIHGGHPERGDCNGCIDYCHLPEISLTEEEATRLREIYLDVEEPLGDLAIRDDPDHAGWLIMSGPCVFRRYDRPLASGGCSIYTERPGSCRIFTCRFLLELRRSA